MGNLDFWVQLGVSQVWALVIVAAMFAFGMGMALMRLIDGGQMKALKERKELADERLEQIREQTSDDRWAVAELQARVVQLVGLFHSQASAAAIEPVLKSERRIPVRSLNPTAQL